jgi:hypothetical protein
MDTGTEVLCHILDVYVLACLFATYIIFRIHYIYNILFLSASALVVLYAVACSS